MENLDVRIVVLDPMRVASVRAVSPTPERDAWAKMQAWAGSKGLLNDIEAHPVFGFNNPNPSPGAKEYGYEFWIRVGTEVQSEGDVEVKDFAGGRYAVARCHLGREMASASGEPAECLPSWERLHAWVTASPHECGAHQWLEKALNPGAPEAQLMLELHYPIRG